MRYQGIGRKAKEYQPDECIYENTQPLQQKLKQMDDDDGDVYENSNFHKKPIKPPAPPVSNKLLCNSVVVYKNVLMSFNFFKSFFFFVENRIWLAFKVVKRIQFI